MYEDNIFLYIKELRNTQYLIIKVVYWVVYHKNQNNFFFFVNNRETKNLFPTVQCKKMSIFFKIKYKKSAT